MTIVKENIDVAQYNQFNVSFRKNKTLMWIKTCISLIHLKQHHLSYFHLLIVHMA